MSGKQCITHLSEGPPRARTLTEITNQTWGQRGALLFFSSSLFSLFSHLFIFLWLLLCVHRPVIFVLVSLPCSFFCVCVFFFLRLISPYCLMRVHILVRQNYIAEMGHTQREGVTRRRRKQLLLMCGLFLENRQEILIQKFTKRLGFSFPHI